MDGDQREHPVRPGEEHLETDLIGHFETGVRLGDRVFPTAGAEEQRGRLVVVDGEVGDVAEPLVGTLAFS